MGKKKQSSANVAPKVVDHLDPPPKVRASREQKFDKLEQFEEYIKNESWDNEFDNIDITLEYLPPFIVHEIHGDENNIKESMTALNKKFRRHLHQHLTKHLIPEINKMAGINYKFKKIDEELVPNTYGTSSVYHWHYEDKSNHGFEDAEYEKRNHWKVELDVTCNSDNPYVTVHFQCIVFDPKEEAEAAPAAAKA
ncbi:unnamed protein product [Ambrosiozyma monospora]|uniref:Unnamed protein product n=1 Tax=Ambrosiozyma monospora TaxID=43982 RepID=A0ACB5U8K5_AMBMO|nr:unnamed protein product [Ambrosiozyma monospora]